MGQQLKKTTSSLAVAVTYADFKNSAEIKLVARPVARAVTVTQERISWLKFISKVDTVHCGIVYNCNYV